MCSSGRRTTGLERTRDGASCLHFSVLGAVPLRPSVRRHRTHERFNAKTKVRVVGCACAATQPPWVVGVRDLAARLSVYCDYVRRRDSFSQRGDADPDVATSHSHRYYRRPVGSTDGAGLGCHLPAHVFVLWRRCLLRSHEQPRTTSSVGARFRGRYPGFVLPSGTTRRLYRIDVCGEAETTQ